MDHGDTRPIREALGELVENLIEAESSLLAAQAVMRDSSLARSTGYESIGGNIGGALGATQTALAELHRKFHEPS